MEKLTGVAARRIHVDKGYRGHNHPHRLRVWISGHARLARPPEMERRRQGPFLRHGSEAKSCLTADTSVLIFVTVMGVQAPLRAVIFANDHFILSPFAEPPAHYLAPSRIERTGGARNGPG